MQKDLIYDVGFHHGEDTEFYLAKGFKVVAIEAHPGLYRAGLEKFADHIESGRLVLLNLAVAETFYQIPPKETVPAVRISGVSLVFSCWDDV